MWKDRLRDVVAIIGTSSVLMGCRAETSNPILTATVDQLLNNPSNFVGKKLQVKGFSHGTSPSNIPAANMGVACSQDTSRFITTGVSATKEFPTNNRLLQVVYCAPKNHPLDWLEAKTKEVNLTGFVIEALQSASYAFVAENIK